MPQAMPTRIKAGPHHYSVIRKPARQMGGSLGWCLFDEVQIWIRGRMRKSKTQEKLLHEAIHACVPELDEETVVKLEKPLLQLIRDNPELVAYLQT